MKLTPQLCEALVGLRANRNFEVVLEHMKAHELEETKICTSSEGVSLHRAQGAVNALVTWQKMFADAPQVLEKFKNPQHSQK